MPGDRPAFIGDQEEAGRAVTVVVERYMALPLSIAEAGGGGDGLPVTGSPVALLLVVGAALILGGGGVLVGTRPPRPRPAA